MKKFTVAVIALILGGCASTYDTDKVPEATTNLTIENQTCLNNMKDGKYKNAVEAATCLADSREHFATTIKLTHKEIVAAYRNRVLFLGSQFDQGRLNANQMAYSVQSADRDFFNNITRAAQMDEAERQRASRAMMIMGQSMQNAAAYQNTYQTNAPTITTTTCNAWSSTSGQCTSVTQ